MDRVGSLLAQLERCESEGAIHFKLSPLQECTELTLLPGIYQEYFLRIGVGTVGTGATPGDGYLVFEVCAPTFCTHPNQTVYGYDPDDEFAFFDYEHKHRSLDVLLLGTDVDMQWFGYDITKGNARFVTCWNNQFDRDTTDIVSYLRDILDATCKRGIDF